ncbi:MAG TPA: pitrilysin family protein [Candidatus Paceibacterota bacterium]|nr:pitrilysin family protein [Candidatus Paceibacterota bacterium]
MNLQTLPPTAVTHDSHYRVAFVVFALGLSGLAGLASTESTMADIQSRVQTFTLDNGMRFIVLERRQAPVVTCLTYADVGAAQETKGITGLAHLLEHMAFKGSRRIGTTNFEAERPALDKVDQAFAAFARERQKGDKADPDKLKELRAAFEAAQDEARKYVVPNEFGEAIEKAGGQDLNAMTDSESTCYFFSLPSNELELWFYLESERFRDPVFREFYKERDVVMEERRLAVESDPFGKLMEELLATAFKAHPYGEPVIGHRSDLENLTRADGEAFMSKYYVPSNLVSVLVGDVDVARAKHLAELYFSRLPARPKPEPLRTVEPPQVGERRVTLRLESERLVMVCYHKPALTHPDNAVYRALSSLLSDGRSSRLQRHLVRDKQIATFAAGFSGFPGWKYPNLFLFYAFTAPGHTNAEIEKALDEEIERLKHELVSPQELAGVQRRARANLIRGLEYNIGMALNLANWQVMTEDWRELFKLPDRISRVTAADIQRVAKTMFTLDNRTVGTIEPIEKPASN